ncbi:MAG: hypothetical protein ACJ76H_07755 [Bacteriovoracaceae bacterium]
MKIFLLGLLVSLSSLAVTQDPIPDCMSTWDENVSIQLYYKKIDRYRRDILARVIHASCNSVLRPGTQHFKTVASNATKIGEVVLDKFHQNTLFWIRRGSNYVLPIGYTAAKYVSEHPIQFYSTTLNRQLTEKYGNGFASEIYREWLLSRPENKLARTEIKASVREFLSKGPAFTSNEIRTRAQNTVLIVSMGLGWDESPEQPFYVKDFLKEIKAAGMETMILKRDAMGTVPENIRALVPQVNRIFLSGKQVMLMGLCKGMPELFAATAEVFKANPAVKKRLRGVIGISPMMSGLYWADYQRNHPAVELLHFLLAMIPGKKTQSGSEYLTALQTMNSVEIDALYNDVRPQFPKDVPYVNLIGVIPDDGILKNDTTAMMPFIKANRMLNIGKGANDGFLEYPKSQISSAWGPKVFNIPLEGSHMITDGKFDELDFRNSKNLLGLYYGILRFTLDQR